MPPLTREDVRFAPDSLVERAGFEPWFRARAVSVLCSTFRQLLDVDIREVNAQHLASVGLQPDDQLHPADPVDNKETTVVASDREPNRPAQAQAACLSDPVISARAQEISRRANLLSD